MEVSIDEDELISDMGLLIDEEFEVGMMIAIQLQALKDGRLTTAQAVASMASSCRQLVMNEFGITSDEERYVAQE